MRRHHAQDNNFPRLGVDLDFGNLRRIDEGWINGALTSFTGYRSADGFEGCVGLQTLAVPADVLPRDDPTSRRLS
jgi:hypothetical protein